MNARPVPDPVPGTRVHFVGIGGVGMSALAELLAARGCRVSGSDREGSVITQRLAARGVAVEIGHSAERVRDADLVVFTPAVGDENPEVVAARLAGTTTVRRRDLLGVVTAGKRLVAVAGTHGKTTTTAMTSAVLQSAGMDPTALVGGLVKGSETNLRIGSDRVWVVEADEYDRAFLELSPTVAVVTSLEADHLDQFGTEAAVKQAFAEFLARLSPQGTAVICGDSPGARLLSERDLPVPRKHVLTYGADRKDARIRADQIRTEGFGSRFRVSLDDVVLGEARVQVPGSHNVVNSLAAAGAGLSLGAAWEDIAEGLGRFEGVRRRFEILGRAAGVLVVSDYAHHPTEIAATLAAARSGWDGPIVAVFQPHLYSRTRDFLDGFGQALARADRVWVTEIYAAREAPIAGVTGQKVAEAVRRAGRAETGYVADLERLAKVVADSADDGDLVLVMGAGSIEKAAGGILELLEGRQGRRRGTAKTGVEGTARR